MKSRKVDNGFLLRFDRGEKIVEGLGRFAAEHEIPSACLTGLGALCNTRLGFYILHEKKYKERVISEEMELLNLTGNLSWFQGKPAVHCHVTLGNLDFQALGGHLFEAEVAVTVEIHLSVKKERVERKFVPEMGLNLLDL